MISSKFRLLAVVALVLGAAATAYACGDDDKTSKASLTHAGGSCCASKTSATVASTAGDHCAKGTKAAMAGSEHCAKGAMASGMCTKDAMEKAGCTYGGTSVTMAGTCPSANEADYSFYVAGAECQGTGSEVARAIKAMPGVASVTVDYEKHMAYVCADSKAASKKAIQNSLKKAGYSNVKFVSQSRDNCKKSHGKIEA